MWYQEQKWRNRLLVEAALMRERFPGFLLTRGATGLLSWRGVLRPVKSAPAYEISVTVPARYPYEPPMLRVERPTLLPGAPHLFLNGSLCVYRQSWDPLRGTIASVVPLVAAWLTAYEHWRETGESF
jgi:ubiquitin-protein ligase